MSRDLSVDAETFAAEMAWISQLPMIGSETAVTQVAMLVGGIRLRRTNFDQYRESIIPAQGGDQATLLVDSGRLTGALKKMSGIATMSVEDGSLVIATPDRTIKLKAADGIVNFPKWPEFDGRGKATLASGEIAQALTSLGVDDKYPSLQAVAFDNGSMVTTDRYRMSVVSYNESGFTGRIPGAALKAFAKADAAVFVEAGSCAKESTEWVQLRSNGRAVTAPMLDVQFPQWRRLIPGDPTVQVWVDRARLLKAIAGEEVTLTIDRDALTVTTRDGGMEMAQRIKLFTTIRNTVGVLSTTIASKYVTDALKAVSSGQVLISTTGPGQVMMFQDIAEKDLHLVMPVRAS